ncbi:uncharacterized protein EDB91DRAFT_1158884 [Suillus paluster]|uniref:uncharacterized protein n=1 Tax=Suillus paluster TaxID=48578 RepID=UPI001B873760|nr:uncharacterized protein EDB91DRAFT_1158884 [Suillus paluster]KAG1729865.1 hypothetical protein EDB91DRAFT_1158884 [Suillus paluster]
MMQHLCFASLTLLLQSMLLLINFAISTRIISISRGYLHSDTAIFSCPFPFCSRLVFTTAGIEASSRTARTLQKSISSTASSRTRSCSHLATPCWWPSQLASTLVHSCQDDTSRPR